MAYKTITLKFDTDLNLSVFLGVAKELDKKGWETRFSVTENFTEFFSVLNTLMAATAALEKSDEACVKVFKQAGWEMGNNPKETQKGLEDFRAALRKNDIFV